MKIINKLIQQQNRKVIEEYCLFDDTKEYLDYYLTETNKRWSVPSRNFSRIGYGKWEKETIDGITCYSYDKCDYEKVTEKVYKELLEMATKTYSVHIDQHKYHGEQGNCRFTGSCKTVEDAVEESKKMAQKSIDQYQEQIDKIQVKIDYLKSLDHKSLVKTEYTITYPIEVHSND
jgi:uncharacterized protein YjhX (UPF0386 family)